MFRVPGEFYHGALPTGGQGAGRKYFHLRSAVQARQIFENFNDDIKCRLLPNTVFLVCFFCVNFNYVNLKSF
jgi:hypothetical protein